MGISDKIPEEHGSLVIIDIPRSVSEVLAIWSVAVGSQSSSYVDCCEKCMVCRYTGIFLGGNLNSVREWNGNENPYCCEWE